MTAAARSTCQPSHLAEGTKYVTICFWKRNFIRKLFTKKSMTTPTDKVNCKHFIHSCVAIKTTVLFCQLKFMVEYDSVCLAICNSLCRCLGAFLNNWQTPTASLFGILFTITSLWFLLTIGHIDKLPNTCMCKPVFSYEYT